MKIFIFLLLLIITCFQAYTVKGRCAYKNRQYHSGESFTFIAGDKHFTCNCDSSEQLLCTYSYSISERATRCYEKSTRQFHNDGDSWEIRRGERQLTCDCQVANGHGVISCTDADRCYKNGKVYSVGDEFISGSISGIPSECVCMEGGLVSCQVTVEEEPLTSEEGDIIREVEIVGGRSLHPKIKALQACDSGHRIIASGAAWNNTVTAYDGTQYKEECVCSNALITCKKIRNVGRIEPVCLSVDGQIRKVRERWLQVYTNRPTVQYECVCTAHEKPKCRRPLVEKCLDDDGVIRRAGERFIRVHKSFSNLRFRCTCHRNWSISCVDIGYCEKLTAPINGAMLCARSKGLHGTQKYCRPMCLEGYEFTSNLRYHQTIETCGYSNQHRWSGGFAVNPLSIAKCKRSELPYKRGHNFLYLPTSNCNSLSSSTRKAIEQGFLWQLRRSGFCGASCQTEYFECGVKRELREDE